MANTSSRTLRLLSLLQTHRHWAGGELAERLEVSVRTLRRDVDRLRALGYPVAAERGVDGGYQLAPGAALPPLVMDDDEAVALAVGMQDAAQGGVAGLEEAALRALTKVVQVMPPRLRRRVDALRAVTVPATWGGGPPTDAAVLSTLALACRDTERLRFDYVARSGAPSARHVEPLRLVPLRRHWYLVAYDLDRHDWRSFRLDRLADPHGTAVSFNPRELPAADAAAFVRQGIADVPAPFSVEVVVQAAAGPVRDRIGRWSTVEELGPGGGGGAEPAAGGAVGAAGPAGPAGLAGAAGAAGSVGSQCVVRMTADALEWPALALGLIGADFRVVTPPELIALLGDWGERFSRAAAQPGRAG